MLCHYAQCHYVNYYAECHYTESRYAECSYAECHYAEYLTPKCDQNQSNACINFVTPKAAAKRELLFSKWTLGQFVKQPGQT
jgi:hypothetical protein